MPGRTHRRPTPHGASEQERGSCKPRPAICLACVLLAPAYTTRVSMCNAQCVTPGRAPGHPHEPHGLAAGWVHRTGGTVLPLLLPLPLPLPLLLVLVLVRCTAAPPPVNPLYPHVVATGAQACADAFRRLPTHWLLRALPCVPCVPTRCRWQPWCAASKAARRTYRSQSHTVQHPRVFLRRFYLALESPMVRTKAHANSACKLVAMGLLLGLQACGDGLLIGLAGLW